MQPGSPHIARIVFILDLQHYCTHRYIFGSFAGPYTHMLTSTSIGWQFVPSPIIPSPHSIAISTLPAEFSNFPRKLMRPSRASIEIVWLSYPGVGRISGALLSNAAIQVEPRERLRYEVEHHDFGGFRAGREVLHVRRYLDVHQYYRDFVQQVALGVRGLPLPDFPHAVAHVLLQHRWVPLRARLQGGSTRAPSPSPVALSSDP